MSAQLTLNLFILTGFAAMSGAAVGSFAAVVTSRGVAASLGGRSHCDGCGRTLRWFELVPLLSYPVLRGRCRTCKADIGWGAILWEVGGAVVGSVLLLALIRP